MACFMGMITVSKGIFKRKKFNTENGSTVGAEKMSRISDVSCNHVTKQVQVKN